MVKVKCFYEDGNTIITQINGTFEDAKHYFLRSFFNIGVITDNLQKCIKIEKAN